MATQTYSLAATTVINALPVSTLAPSRTDTLPTIPAIVAFSSFCILSVSLGDTRDRPL